MAIKIKESKKGTFTKAAKNRNLGVQEFARKVLANKDKYSTAMVKKANFARNSTKWKKELGGVLSGLQNFSSIGDLALPGLGSALSSALSVLQAGVAKKILNKNIEKSLTQQTVNTNPFGFALGGMLKGRDDLGHYKNKFYLSGGILEGKADLGKYKGNTHEENGINVDSNGIPKYEGVNEVENDETVFRYKDISYIFSNRLKV